MVMQQEVSAPVADELPPFAYDQLGEPGSITEQAVIEDLGITTLTLSNGIRINLKPVDFQKGSIKIGAYIDGGSIRMLDKPGLAAMAGSVMQQGGLEAHDLTELEKIMAGEHVSLNFGMGADRIRMSGSTTAEDFELQCKLLVAGILHPGYRKDGEERLRRGLASMYNRFETTSNGAFSYQAPRHIYGSDPRFITPTREQMEQCTAEQVKDYVLNSVAPEQSVGIGGHRQHILCDLGCGSYVIEQGHGINGSLEILVVVDTSVATNGQSLGDGG